MADNKPRKVPADWYPANPFPSTTIDEDMSHTVTVFNTETKIDPLWQEGDGELPTSQTGYRAGSGRGGKNYSGKPVANWNKFRKSS